MKPLLGYYGGKAGPVGAWIAAQLPPHRVYVEPFGGMAGVLLAKRPSPVEVYNDKADVLVNLFRVLRDETSRGALREALELTPSSRSEYRACARGQHAEGIADVERARRTYVVLAQSRDNSLLGKGWSHGGAAYTGSVADTFVNGQARIPEVATRLRTVQIENRCALDVIRQWQAADVLKYVDPPYTLTERNAMGYVHELADADHRALLDALLTDKGMVLLSGYRNPMYAEMLEQVGWLRRDFATVAHSAAARTSGKKAQRVESLWLNPAAAAATPQLFQ